MFGETHHAWLHAFRRNLFGYACALCGDTAGAEDLYQEAVLRAMSAASVPDEARRFRVWMFRLTRNLWIDTLRSRRHHDAWSEEIASIDGEDRAQTGSEEITVNRLAVRQAFTRLSKPHRDVLALVDIGGFSYDETAELLDVPRGTVMSRISRARTALARQLSDGPVVAMPLKRRGRA